LFRGRRRLPRAWLLPSLALLALAAIGPVPALAGEPVTDHTISPKILRPDPIPEPRVQEPGQTPGYRLPIAAGQEFRIEQGWNSGFSHVGKNAYAYDFGMALGTDVYAAAAGLVAFTHDGETACGGRDLLMKTNYVTIYHADGSASLYAHLSEVGVKVGDIVAAGQVIGKSGNTGYTNCVPHLHFARQYQGHSVSQSVPVYFEGYAKQEFHTGDVVSIPPAPCTAPSAADDSTGTGTAARTEAGNQAAAVKQTEAAREPDLGTFCGVYYGGDLDQPAAFVRSDGLLNFDWRSKGPGGYWLDSAKIPFAARWTGDFIFASAGTYSIGVIATGEVKVSIDGDLVVDRWTDEARPVDTLVSKALGAGIHRVDVEYMTSGHGMLKLGWGRLLADG
jgi:murein DD-endopeptidase MepM/ murein hydrolase activator NlpD